MYSKFTVTANTVLDSKLFQLVCTSFQARKKNESSHSVAVVSALSVSTHTLTWNSHTSEQATLSDTTFIL